MTDWRDQIVNKILWQDPLLIVVLDPDQLLLEEQIFKTIQANGFDMLTYIDPIAFRYAYETSYRTPWDAGTETPRLIVRFPHTRRESVPYDLLEWGECIQVTVADLFPGFDYQIVRSPSLVRHYDALFEASQKIRGKRFSQKQTAGLILDQIFSIRPEAVLTPTDLIVLLCRIHSRHQIIPDVLIDHCLKIWADHHHVGFPEIRPLFDHDIFMAYLQDEWTRYLSAGGASSTVPFDNDQIRPYIDTFFLEGALKPVPAPPSAQIPQWAHCGVIHDQDSEDLQRLERLLEQIQATLPGSDTRLDDWKQCARIWAEAVVLYSARSPPIPEPIQTRYQTLHQTIEATFGDWILATYPTLPDRPYLPTPVMVHQIPHYLAHHAGDDRVALIVMDGMALNQWLIIREMLGEGFTYTEDLVCAWVPTLTSISRRSIFAGEKPSLISGLNRNKQTEEHLWRTFWNNQSKPDRAIGYSRGNNLFTEADVDKLVHDATPAIAGFVINTIDNFMHSTIMGMPQMHDSIRRWMKKSTLKKFITGLLDRGYQVYITADHGNVSARGIGIPRQGDLVEETSVRARIYNHASFAEDAHKTYPEDSCVWPSHYLGTGHAVLLASGLKAFYNLDQEVLSHGSISVEEVFVPFVQIRSTQKCHR